MTLLARPEDAPARTPAGVGICRLTDGVGLSTQ
jgi:hypothetical protein